MYLVNTRVTKAIERQERGMSTFLQGKGGVFLGFCICRRPHRPSVFCKMRSQAWGDEVSTYDLSQQGLARMLRTCWSKSSAIKNPWYMWHAAGSHYDMARPFLPQAHRRLQVFPGWLGLFHADWGEAPFFEHWMWEKSKVLGLGLIQLCWFWVISKERGIAMYSKYNRQRIDMSPKPWQKHQAQGSALFDLEVLMNSSIKEPLSE